MLRLMDSTYIPALELQRVLMAIKQDEPILGGD